MIREKKKEKISKKNFVSFFIINPLGNATLILRSLQTIQDLPRKRPGSLIPQLIQITPSIHLEIMPKNGSEMPGSMA